MNAWLSCIVVLVLLALPFTPVIADDTKEIARLVKQLGSDVFKEREEPRKSLEEIGEPALDALNKAQDNLEMRRRADAITTVIENKIYPEMRITAHTSVVVCVSVSADGCINTKATPAWS